MTWLAQSIMRTRGTAQGRTPDVHQLTEAKQGKYHYTIGPYTDPVLHVRPGDRVVVETRDAFEGAVKTERDLPSRVLKMPFVNPQTASSAASCSAKALAERSSVMAATLPGKTPAGPGAGA